MHFVCAQHVAFEPPGNLARWVRERGDALTVLHLYREPEIPTTQDYDGLFILGGPMSVNDEATLPWLREEKQMVREAIGAGKPVFGICLGAQMIADVLGAKVQPMGYREIGFFPVHTRPESQRGNSFFRTVPETFLALHWHGEFFQIPKNARHLASSEACPNQAFEYGSAVGVQFHIEMGSNYLDDMADHCGEELSGNGRFIQPLNVMRGEMTRLGEGPYQLLEGILNRWVGK